MNESLAPLGIRNNNPGNIRIAHGTTWLGQTGETEGGYVVFRIPLFGLRAIAKLLRNYQRFYGLDTVEKIISRWAPPGPVDRNDTEAYIEDVAHRLQISKDKQISFIDLKKDIDLLCAFVIAIVWHENGQQPYDPKQVKEAVGMAFTS